jgi:hypothetical protein
MVQQTVDQRGEVLGRLVDEGHLLFERFEFSKIWLGFHFLPGFSKNQDLVEDITGRC